MACILTSGYTFLGCKGGASGIKKIYLTEFENNSGTGYTFTATAGLVTAYTLATSKKYRVYALDKEMGMFTSPGTYTPASGTISYEPQIDFTIKKLTTTVIQEIQLVAQNVLTMMVEDINGDIMFVSKAEITEETRKVKNDTSLSASDGLHYSAKEMSIWADKVVSVIQTIIRHN